ncbi:cytochrome P450 [Schizophyllum commune H4-8]|uniref:Cytochrome P450 n=1 Tax=Schizophyllum commune (strain H4-8 / FGSC 9210) TaxID=578458 RepID=D8Q9A3_SCHCM|nr:cytochrome P450 [Schizophyllum commune H4-8]KAI5890495.1 cytochrome P450 [Schizophyllum commune H4-8]
MLPSSRRSFCISPTQLESLPTVGFSSPILSYFSAIRFLWDAKAMTEEGCARYPGKPFKIANVSRWIVVVSGTALVDELRRGAGDALSFTDAAEEIAQISLVLGESVGKNPYHIPVLQTQLTHNIHDLIPAMRDEMQAVFEDQVPTSGEGWQAVPALTTVTEVICRITNRVFVGIPLCRDQGYIDLCTGFAHKALQAMLFLSIIPSFLRPFAVKVISGLPKAVHTMQCYLEPILAERLPPTHRSGVQAKDNNDLITWLLADGGGGDQDVLHDLALRILTANFASLHTTSMTFTHAMYNLAAYSGYTELMRSEVQEVVAEDGWNKAAIDKMYLVDSFLRETMRLQSLRDVGVMRKVIKPFTFRKTADGIPATIPTGVFVFAAVPTMHSDVAVYGNDAHSFDGFRFVPSHIMQYERIAPRNALVGTSPNFLAWGAGKHQCPGRFFAAVETKMMLAYVVTTFDVATDTTRNGCEGSTRPKDFRLEANCFPNPWARVRMRRCEPVQGEEAQNRTLE